MNGDFYASRRLENQLVCGYLLERSRNKVSVRERADGDEFSFFFNLFFIMT